LSRKGTLPDEGRTCKCNAKSKISRIAIQKFGIAVPSAVRREMPTSRTVDARTAAKMPRANASPTASVSERNVSSRVTGNLVH